MSIYMMYNIHPGDLSPERQTPIQLPTGPSPLGRLLDIFSSQRVDLLHQSAPPLLPSPLLPRLSISASRSPIVPFSQAETLVVSLDSSLSLTPLTQSVNRTDRIGPGCI